MVVLIGNLESSFARLGRQNRSSVDHLIARSGLHTLRASTLRASTFGLRQSVLV